MAPTNRARVRFGPFELDLRNRELRRQGVRLRVQRQPFAVLEALLEAPGQLVTRETLRQRLWPEGTFVEFDKGLNTAVMKLREALGEDPHSPHFIETVAREGYRFVAPVEVVSAPHPLDTAAERGGEPAPTEARRPPADALGLARLAGTASRSRKRLAASWVLLTLALAALLVSGLLLARPRSTPTSRGSLRFAIREPPGAIFSTSGSFMALSPDGRSLAFAASSEDGVHRLWLQRLDSLTALELAGTENAVQPFWSPDSTALAFFADGRLKRLDLGGGPPQTLAAVFPSGLAGGWSRDGRLLYATARANVNAEHRGLMLGSAEGGAATPVPVPAGIDPAADLWWPRLLPDGRSYLVLVHAPDPAESGLYAATLDGAAERISPATSSAEYAGGHLFYVDHGVLLAQPFDPDHRRATSRAVPLADGVRVNPRTGRATFSVSGANGGILALQQPTRARLEWFDRSGGSLGVAGSPAAYHDFSLAPDGRRVAATILDPETGTHDIWILDSGGARSRFTWGAASEVSAHWSADGSRIAYATDASGRWQVVVRTVDGGGEEQLVAESASIVAPTGWAGPVLYVGRFNPQVDVSLRQRDGLQLVADASMGIFDSASPDRRFIAYARGDTTSRVAAKAIYVDAAAPAQGSWRVAERGNEPRWRGDAAELYWVDADRRLMAVRVGPGGPVARPEPLFATPGVEPSGLEGGTYDVSPDGQSFLLKVPAEPSAIVVLANWTSRLEQERGISVARW